jgi:hypothetical protein
MIDAGPPGLAIGNNLGTTTIIASATNKAGAVITGSTTLTEESPGGGGSLPALTVYEGGLGSGSVEIPTAGTCTPSTSPAECTGDFVLNSTVTLTATPAGFGGWSANCTPITSTSCQVVMNNNRPVGAIFNKP